MLVPCLIAQHQMSSSKEEFKNGQYIFPSTLKILPGIKLRRYPFYLAQMVAIMPFLCIIRMGIYLTTAARKTRTEEILASTNKKRGNV